MRAIRRSKKFEEMVRQLAEKPHSVTGRPIFPTIRELMCFVAVLGFEHKRRNPIQNEYFEVDSRNFERSEAAVDLLYLIGLATEKNVDILREEEIDKMVSIFEEYAQGGFEILESWLREKPEDTDGDKAVLAALNKYGFLSTRDDVDVSIHNISF
jgi:dnd system-associated protein 4